jgi:hypothetical protein
MAWLHLPGCSMFTEHPDLPVHALGSVGIVFN